MSKAKPGKSAGEAGKKGGGVHGGVQGRGGADALGRSWAGSICERLGLSSPNLLYGWKREAIRQGGAAAVGLEGRVRELEAELRRVERERDILKKRSPFSAATDEGRVCRHRSVSADGVRSQPRRCAGRSR